MKKLLGMLIICLISVSSYAQNDETLLSGKIKSGGFGGPVFRITSVNGVASVFTGARGGWIMKFPSGDSFVLGGGGCGLITHIRLNDVYSPYNQPLYLNLGYGGLDLEYIHATSKLIHFSIETLIGAGNVGYTQRNHDRYDNYPGQSFFVCEPGINLLMNITNFFMVGTGLSYRYINGTHLAGTSDKQLSNLSGILTFKFGKF